MILGRKVYIQLLRKDQYSRVVSEEVCRECYELSFDDQVAQVHLAPRILPGFLFYGKNIPADMLKAGWAVTYEQVCRCIHFK